MTDVAREFVDCFHGKFVWRFARGRGRLGCMSMSLQDIKSQIRALPKEQKRELTSDLIEEISGEDFPVSAGLLEVVKQRIADAKGAAAPVTTLDQIEARIRGRKHGI